MKRNTAELKEKLIATGVEEIRTRGVDQLSIRTVAQRCGVTHGAPYKHFENKDVYLQVVLEHLSEIFLKYLTKGVDSSLDVRGQLVLMGCNFVEFAQKKQIVLRPCLLSFLSIIWSSLGTVSLLMPIYQGLSTLRVWF